MKKFLFFLFLLIAPFACKNKLEKVLDLNFNSNSAAGCASFFVYQFNEGYDVGLSVSGNRDSLGLSTSPQVYDLSQENKLEVSLLQFDGMAQQYFCDDVVGDDPNVINTWEGESGLITVTIIQDTLPAGMIGGQVLYKITVEAADIQLKDEAGDIQEIDSAIFENVIVGWLPG